MLLLENPYVKTVEEVPFLLAKFEGTSDFQGFKLYLLEKRGEYIVYSDTCYFLDNTLTRHYEAFHKVQPALTEDFKRSFGKKEDALSFIQEVLSALPEPFDWTKYQDKVQYCGKFTQNEIFYNSFNEPYEIKDHFHVDLLIHGMQKIFIRAFLRETSVIVNKQWTFKFESEKDAKIFFNDLKKHFSVKNPKVIQYEGPDFKREELLSQISDIVSTGDHNVSKKANSLGKIYDYELNAIYKGKQVHIRIQLPTRNSVLNDADVSSSISVTDRKPLNWFGDEPRRENVLLSELEDVISYLKQL